MDKLTRPAVQVGDEVTTAYEPAEQTVIRRVVAVIQDPHCTSGWSVSVDGGRECPMCGRAVLPIEGLDSTWVQRVEAATGATDAGRRA